MSQSLCHALLVPSPVYAKMSKDAVRKTVWAGEKVRGTVQLWVLWPFPLPFHKRVREQAQAALSCSGLENSHQGEGRSLFS